MRQFFIFAAVVACAITCDSAVLAADEEPLPLAVHAEFDSNPKAVEPPPSVYVRSEMEATMDSDGKLIVKKFRNE